MAEGLSIQPTLGRPLHWNAEVGATSSGPRFEAIVLVPAAGTALVSFPWAKAEG
jgi:hypothetical protein